MKSKFMYKIRFREKRRLDLPIQLFYESFSEGLDTLNRPNPFGFSVQKQILSSNFTKKYVPRVTLKIVSFWFSKINLKYKNLILGAFRPKHYKYNYVVGEKTKSMSGKVSYSYPIKNAS